jgi:DtxR family Mn-dependent transcriptional regulator
MLGFCNQGKEMSTAYALSASLEDYLETIFLLVQRNRVARSRDIARRLEVNRSSVTGALKSLAEKGLVNYERYGYITLTEQGDRVARDVVRRHETLKDFFVKVLAVNEVEADKAACQMEHAIPRHIVERLIDFAEFVEICPRAGSRWVHGLGYQCREAPFKKETCERCIEHCLDDLKKKKQSGAMSMSVALKDLKPGEKGQIESVGGTGAVGRRILDMGVTRGSLVEVVRVAPLGDPVEVKVKGYRLTLRKNEAAAITVKKIED